MEMKYILILVICGAIALVGAAAVIYEIFRITAVDAEARGLKHPKFWGFFAVNGNNSSGLILYLLGRRKYPIVNLSEEKSLEIEKRKKTAGVGLIFLAIGAIGMVIGISFL